MQLQIEALAERPELLPTVAEWIYKARASQLRRLFLEERIARVAQGATPQPVFRRPPRSFLARPPSDQ